MDSDLEYAKRLDDQDIIARFRDEFVVADSNVIYLDGNSLGRLPIRTATRTRDIVARQWGERLIRAWQEGWFSAAETIGAKIAQLIGAQSDEVIVADSTSVNLFKVGFSALQCQPGRVKIVSDDLNFPSDLYVLEGIARLAGPAHELTLVRSRDGITLPTELLTPALDGNTALVALTQTSFKSSFTYNLASVTEAAHRCGALMLWDLSHSVGVMPIDLNGANVDMAVGCTYKYLNGGPGAPAFLYIRRDLQQRMLSPIRAWFGQRDQFEFALNYDPAPGIGRFQTGTPAILAMSAIEPGVDLVLEAGVERIREKSMRQTEYLVELWHKQLKPLGVSLNSPVDATRRGSHVSFGHTEGWRIAQALIEEMSVIPDFRYPDNIRFGIAPLYTTFAEICEAVSRLRDVITRKIYERFSSKPKEVT
jgi:kynureninase